MKKLLLGIIGVALAANVSAQSLDFGKVKTSHLPYVGVKSSPLTQVKSLDQVKPGKKMSSRMQLANAATFNEVSKSMRLNGASIKRNSSSAVAADAPLAWWGYPKESSGQVLTFGFDLLAQAFGATFLSGQTDYNVACLIPGNYAEAKIDSVEFVIYGGQKYENLTVWVAPYAEVEEKGKVYYNPPVSPDDAAVKVVVPADEISKIPSGKAGFIGVKLPVSYKIPADGCFVGYAFKGESSGRPIITWATDGTNGGLLYKYDTGGVSVFDNFYSLGLGDLTIQIGMDVSECEANSASVSADAEQTVLVGAANQYNFYVANNCAKAITSIDYIISEDGEVGEERHLDLSSPIAANDYGVLPLANKVFSTDGVHTIELTVTKVNGNQNIAEDNTASNSIIALEKGAERTSVVEELTGTWCGWCPRGHVGLENLKKTFGDKVITLAGHYTFGENAVDPMNCYEYNQNDVLGNYGVVANQLSSYLGGSGLPGAMFDRLLSADPYMGLNNQLNQQGTVDYGADDLVNAINQAIPSEASVNLSASWTDDTKTAIKVDFSTTFNYDRFGENPYGVGFILSENAMKGTGTQWMQLNYYSNSYKDYRAAAAYYKNADMLSWFEAEPFVPMEYSNVVVQSWRPLGDALFTESEESDIVKGEVINYTNTLPVTSTLIQDKDMLSLTAILVNLNNLGIVNAAQVHLGAGAAGITDVQKDANSTVVERYNLNGMRVNAPQKGLNIVKLADGRCVKVAVK